MARHFGSIATSVWDDPDWWELSGEAQRVYLMLITQATISPVGTVPMTLKRWANSTNGCTIKGLTKALEELSDAAYVVVDWDREELLVRSFVRWDKGYTNELRLKAIKKTAPMVGSRLLAGALAHELNRLGIDHGITAEPIDALSKALTSPIEDVPKDAGSKYLRTWVLEPEPGTGNQEPGTRASAAPVAPRESDPFDEFWSLYPRTEGRKPAQASFAKALRRISFGDLMAHLHRQLSDPDCPDKGYWPHAATWLNQDRWNDRFTPRRNGQQHKPATADLRVGEGLDLAHRLAAQEAAAEAQTRLEIGQ
jgi:hypothetical protein